MLEVVAPFFSRGVDSLVRRRGENSEKLVLREELDDLLAQAPGGEGPNWRSFLVILRAA